MSLASSTISRSVSSGGKSRDGLFDMKLIQDWSLELGLRLYEDAKGIFWAELANSGQKIAVTEANRELLAQKVVEHTGRKIESLDLNQKICWALIASLF
jgi:hypothetical protein